MGNESSVDDDGNVYYSGDNCLTYVCGAGVLVVLPPKAPMTCWWVAPWWEGKDHYSGYCGPNPDPNGSTDIMCDECDVDTGLGCQKGTTCMNGVCIAPHCMDGVQDDNEPDVDCGKSAGCFPCEAGKKCFDHSSGFVDCYSLNCASPDGGLPGPDGGTCMPPTCSDDRQNQDETDVDCGGTHCLPCRETYDCLRVSDCQSGVCAPSGLMGTGFPSHCAAPSCTDGVQNGSETGIDCGGDGGCAPCGP